MTPLWGSKDHPFLRDHKDQIQHADAIGSAGRHEDLAIKCYHGGRNEWFLFGAFDEVFTDYYLEGAYSTASAAVVEPDFDNLMLAMVWSTSPDGIRPWPLRVQCVSQDSNGFVAMASRHAHPFARVLEEADAPPDER